MTAASEVQWLSEQPFEDLLRSLIRRSVASGNLAQGVGDRLEDILLDAAQEEPGGLI
ncbi:MAG: hypothetical protein QOH56_848 [Pseudonocardiales bacterium]|jgi:hypothetical protein|nr:hypothetical protein [Pseudonocardiales bacterium]